MAALSRVRKETTRQKGTRAVALTAATGVLEAHRILIVEDEYFLADDLARALGEAGAEVVGPVGTLDEAEQIVRTETFDCAILDMNLRGDMAFPIADHLALEGIPFIITTGYNSASLPKRFANVPRVEKPFDPAAVIAAVPGAINPRG
jgi:DNA-binding response OmpR family regulator